MMFQRLVFAEVTSAFKNYGVCFLRMQEFFYTVDAMMGEKIQVTKIQIRGTGPEYYFCRGRTRYKSPLEQQKAIRESGRRSEIKGMLLSIIGFQGRRVLDLAAKISHRLQAKALMHRMTNRGEEAIVCDNETTEAEVDETFRLVQKQIQNSLGLDMNRSPRLSRTGATLISVHKRRQANERERSMVMHTAVQ